MSKHSTRNSACSEEKESKIETNFVVRGKSKTGTFSD